MTRVGAITIGHSPRADVVPDLRRLLGPEVEIVERGALDPWTPGECRSLAPRTTGPVLVTRLRDGSEITLGAKFVEPLVADAVRGLDQQVDLILLLCTGSFPRFTSRRPVLYPEHVLASVVRAIDATRIGVLTPAAEQRDEQRARWQRIVPTVVVEAATPYRASDDLSRASRALAAADVDAVVMDCLGYTSEMKRVVRETTRRPVLLARSCLARVAAELVGD